MTRALTANAPLPLTALAGVWTVVSGLVDIFAVGMVDGAPSGRRLFVLRLLPGEALAGLDSDPGDAFTLIAVGGLGTSIHPAEDDSAAEGWVRALGGRLRDPSLGWGERIASAGLMSLRARAWRQRGSRCCGRRYPRGGWKAPGVSPPDTATRRCRFAPASR
jgi:hypothetical protein